jgi:hypothetical protein
VNGGALLRAALGVVLVASLAASLAGVWLVAANVRHGNEGKPPRSPSGSGADDARRDLRANALGVPGLVGEVQIQGRLRLGVRLVRLHASAGEQSFDARALQQRLHLPAGEPFVCELRLFGTPVAANDARNGAAAFDLARLKVVDEQGDALVPFANVEASGDPATLPADPLATLLAPPVEPLRPGEAISIALWGREPLARARVIGIADARARAERAEPRAVGNPVEIVVALAGASLAQSEVDTALARVGAPSRTGSAKDEGR